MSPRISCFRAPSALTPAAVPGSDPMHPRVCRMVRNHRASQASRLAPSARRHHARSARRDCVLVGCISALLIPAVAVGQGPTHARVVLTVSKPSFFLGENVLLHYCLENTSTATFEISVGSDYRGSSRSLRFKMTVTDELGAVVPDPDPGGYNEGADAPRRSRSRPRRDSANPDRE
jgi:hypothetical protein